MNPSDLEDRLQDLLDGQLTSDERHELFGELEDNPKARHIYLEFVHLQMALEAHREPAPCISTNVLPMDRILARQRRRSVKIAAWSTAAVLLIGAVIALRIILPAPPLALFRTSPETELSITHATGADHDLSNGELAVGSHLNLTAGALELELRSGVRAVVRAPAEFTIRSESVIGVAQGTAWFHVPKKAIGFQVDTPDLLLTDLGTKFGVVSKPDIPDQVHVFTGLVEVRNHHEMQESLEVSAEEAREAGRTGGWKAIPFNPDLFFTELSDHRPLPPHLYWSFDSIENGVVPTAGLHPAAKKTTLRIGEAGQGPALVEGVVGNAARFDTENDSLVSNWPGVPGNQPRTVAFWLKLPTDSPDYDATLLNWGQVDGSSTINGEWFVRATNYDYTDPATQRSRRVASTRLQLHFGASWFIGTTDLADGEWHHLAICYGGKVDPNGDPKVGFYLDGRLERASYYASSSAGGAPVQTITDDKNSLPLTIGRSRSNPSLSCNAVLDELYIFDRELSHDSIRRLANP